MAQNLYTNIKDFAELVKYFCGISKTIWHLKIGTSTSIHLRSCLISNFHDHEAIARYIYIYVI